jgi:hypothetical protein
MENLIEIPLFTKKEFNELVGTKESYWLHSRSIKNKTDLFNALCKDLFSGFEAIYVFTASKKSFIDSVKEYLQKDICAKSTSIERFPIGKFIPCLIGDPFKKDLRLIGQVEDPAGDTYFIFQTKEDDLILSWKNYVGKVSCIEPASKR